MNGKTVQSVSVISAWKLKEKIGSPKSICLLRSYGSCEIRIDPVAIRRNRNSIKRRELHPAISPLWQREDPDKFLLLAFGKRRCISDSGTE